MSDYFDFVMCRKDAGTMVQLYRAPAWSHLESGDEVYVEGEDTEKKMIVMASITIGKDETEMIDFIMKATNADTDVKKVVKKVVYRYFDYEEES